MPSTIPGKLQQIIGQSLLGFNQPYSTQKEQLITVIIGKITEPLCPAKLRIIWSIYETYIRIAIIEAIQPMRLTNIALVS